MIKIFIKVNILLLLCHEIQLLFNRILFFYNNFNYLIYILINNKIRIQMQNLFCFSKEFDGFAKKSNVFQKIIVGFAQNFICFSKEFHGCFLRKSMALQRKPCVSQRKSMAQFSKKIDGFAKKFSCGSENIDGLAKKT